MRVLVAGAFGLLGPYLVEALSRRGWTVTTLSRTQGTIRVDLSDREASRRCLDQHLDAVVNCVALTDVDRCQNDPEAAWRDNVSVVENLAEQLAPTCHLVQVSTDQVYPGTAGPHREATVGPVNEYGATKLLAECAAIAHPVATVLRTNVFGPSLVPHRVSLSDWVIGKLSEGEQISGFADLTFSPLRLASVAELTSTVIAERITGTFNLGSREGLSKLEFAREVARRYGLDEGAILPASSAADPRRAPRPADTTLDVDLFESTTGTVLPTLNEEIQLI